MFIREHDRVFGWLVGLSHDIYNEPGNSEDKCLLKEKGSTSRNIFQSRGW